MEILKFQFLNAVALDAKVETTNWIHMV